MYVIKYIKPKRETKADQEQLAIARASSQLGRGEVIVEAVLDDLRDVLGTRPNIDQAVIAAVVACVSGAMTFVAQQDTPAAGCYAFYENEEARVQEFANFLSETMRSFVSAVPADDGEPGVFEISVPLIGLVRDGKGLLQQLVERILPFHFDGSDFHLGASLARDLVARMCKVSGFTEEQARQRPNRVKWPRDIDLSNEKITEAFLGGTPLGTLLLTPVPVKISDRVRLEHMVITAGSGHGKTQTLQHMIAADLNRTWGQEVSMVILDSTGDLIKKMSRLSTFANNDRLMLIDASDFDHPVGLNLFNLGGANLDTLSARDREQVLNSTVQLYEYIVAGLFGSDMTQKQSVVFRFLIRLMLSIPGATIHTLRDVLVEPNDFVEYMEALPSTARQFFLTEFMDRQFTETRKQILRRLYTVLENTTFERMFGSGENKLDLYHAINAGRIVVCNTSREFLGDACGAFGRYCIATTLKAAFDRTRLAQSERRTAFLYIDEASDYFDDNIAKLLEQVRKFKLGVILAHQDIEQMSDKLRASVMSNTAIKLAGGGSAKDARYLAQELRTSPEFVLSQFKDDRGTRFATFVRNVIPEAVSWRVPFGTLERMPQMSVDQYARLLARNRAELTASSTYVETPQRAVRGGSTSRGAKSWDARNDDSGGLWEDE